MLYENYISIKRTLVFVICVVIYIVAYFFSVCQLSFEFGYELSDIQNILILCNQIYYSLLFTDYSFWVIVRKLFSTLRLNIHFFQYVYDLIFIFRFLIHWCLFSCIVFKVWGMDPLLSFSKQLPYYLSTIY